MSHTLPSVSLEMLSPSYWVSDGTSREDKTPLRTDYQEHIFQHTKSMWKMFDLWEQSQQSSVEVPIPPLPPSPAPTLYSRSGELFSEEFWAELTDRITSAKPLLPKLQPGFAVRRCDLRRYPTEEPAYRQEADREFDRFQDTALHTFEPLLILLETADENWNYVISTTYAGWVAKANIARATPGQFERWANFTSDIGVAFVIPMANSVYTQAAPYDPAVSKVHLEFGAYLPIADEDTPFGNQSLVGNIGLLLPVRNATGWLEVHRALVSRTAPLHIGFRTYSREAVVESAFALLGERYGWGDSFGNHDCSSLIMDSYRTVGIQFPRDADKQEEALPNAVLFSEGMSIEERSELLKSLSPGDPLYMPGHTMMYLGYRDGHHYVIHDFAGYAVETKDGVKNIPVNEVMVSTLDILTSRNCSYLDELTGAARLFV